LLTYYAVVAVYNARALRLLWCNTLSGRHVNSSRPDGNGSRPSCIRYTGHCLDLGTDEDTHGNAGIDVARQADALLMATMLQLLILATRYQQICCWTNCCGRSDAIDYKLLPSAEFAVKIIRYTAIVTTVDTFCRIIIIIIIIKPSVAIVKATLRVDAVHLFVHLSVCLIACRRKRFSQKLRNLELWSPLTTNGKS